MIIDISGIVKSDGASLNLQFATNLNGLDSLADTFTFDTPLEFIGTLTNHSGRLLLSGTLKYTYTTYCYRCLKTLTALQEIGIKEEFVDSGTIATDDMYTFDTNNISLTKPLIDNIVLNLPMKSLCDEGCKGLCPMCGNNLNESSCSCIVDDINPNMEILKKLL